MTVLILLECFQFTRIYIPIYQRFCSVEHDVMHPVIVILIYISKSVSVIVVYKNLTYDNLLPIS
jgi:hypothetical protein